MDDIVIVDKDETMQKILSPMLHILDGKNITKGINFVKENERLYICFDKNCLSDSNQLILEKISYIYSETFFHSDNRQSPNSDRLEYWCPNEEYDERTNITERCRNKKMFVIDLDLNDYFTVLGTSIMLANSLQEQDPMRVKVNKELVVLEADVIERHKHYIYSGYSDLKWINLSIFLNKDNPLRENPYAPSMTVCEINSPVSCDNIILSTLVGCNEKTYITFCMDKEEIEKTIKGYFERQASSHDVKEYIDDNQNVRMLLKSFN